MLAFPTALLPSYCPPDLARGLSLSLSGPGVSPIFFLCSLGWGCPVCGGAWGGQALAAGLLSPPQLSPSSS